MESQRVYKALQLFPFHRKRTKDDSIPGIGHGQHDRWSENQTCASVRETPDCLVETSWRGTDKSYYGATAPQSPAVVLFHRWVVGMDLGNPSLRLIGIGCL
jgi:hypothetical protein